MHRETHRSTPYLFLGQLAGVPRDYRYRYPRREQKASANVGLQRGFRIIFLERLGAVLYAIRIKMRY